MKFAEHLVTHLTKEWKQMYVNYEEMKQMLYTAIEQSPSNDVADPDILTRYFAKFDEQFFHYCDSELTKINTFYSEKLAESTRKYANLCSEWSELQSEGSPIKENRFRKPLIRKSRGQQVRKAQELKLAFSEFYLSCVLLQNYQSLNFTGFRKILKKHDKLLNVDYGAKWRQEHVEQAHFFTNKDIDRLIQETEQIVTEIEGGDRTKAMKRLRVPPLGEHQNPWITFKVGLFSGAFFVLVIAVIVSAMFITTKNWQNYDVALRLYRAPFLVILLLFFWGTNVYGWRRSGVNHVLIFEIDPRNHLSEQHIMEFAAIFGVIWSLSLLAFLYSEVIGIPPFICPLALYVLLIAFLLNPTKTLRHEARFWTLRVLSRVLLAPMFFVNFADFWVGDQLTSIVPAFLDFEFFFCFYLTNTNFNKVDDDCVCLNDKSLIRTVVALLPAWIRFSQCLRRYKDTKDRFPHLLNAGKYATSFFVVIFSSITFFTSDSYSKSTDNPWFYMWIVAGVINSCYAYTWDIKMDWGLFDKKAGDNLFLREEIVYMKWSYYAAIISDLVLRFLWTISISMIEMEYLQHETMITILSSLEVFRRFVWNFFRLENEHLNNCGNFRAVRDISVIPMESSDHEKIIKMMDCDDGVVHRHIKRDTSEKCSEKVMKIIKNNQEN